MSHIKIQSNIPIKHSGREDCVPLNNSVHSSYCLLSAKWHIYMYAIVLLKWIIIQLVSEFTKKVRLQINKF